MTEKYLNGVPAGSRASRAGTTVAERYLSEEKLEKVRKLHVIAEERGETLAQTALSWVMRRPEVTSVLVGASSTAQLDDSLASVRGAGFTPEELRDIDGILEGRG